MESENTPESDEEYLVIPETDYSRQEGRDDLYGGDREYDIVYDLDGNISKPMSILYPCSAEEEWIYIEEEKIARLREINCGGSLMTHMNQDINDEQPENIAENADGMDSFFDLDHDGKVSISETIKADAELAETYAEDSKRAGGVKGWFGGVFSRLFKAVDKN